VNIFTVRIEQDALDQIDAVEVFLAPIVGEQVASSYAAKILDFCRGLKLFPSRGLSREDLGSKVNVIGFQRRASVVYTIDDDEKLVSVVGVFYGGQDWEENFSLTPR